MIHKHLNYDADKQRSFHNGELVPSASRNGSRHQRRGSCKPSSPGSEHARTLGSEVCAMTVYRLL